MNTELMGKLELALRMVLQPAVQSAYAVVNAVPNNKLSVDNLIAFLSIVDIILHIHNLLQQSKLPT